MGILRSIRSGGHSNIALATWAIQKLGEDLNDSDDEDDGFRELEDSSSIEKSKQCV